MQERVRKDTNKRKTATKVIEGVVVGRDKTVIPPEEVYKLANIGCKDSEISAWFGIDGNTLRYNFSVELTKGRIALNMSLRRAQIQTALNGQPALLIWLGRNLLGQSENPIDVDSNQVLPWVQDQIEREYNEEQRNA